jgi:hypothetical protein
MYRVEETDRRSDRGRRVVKNRERQEMKRKVSGGKRRGSPKEERQTNERNTPKSKHAILDSSHSQVMMLQSPR